MRQAAEKKNSHEQGELLACDAVDYGLEHCGKLRRLEPAEFLHQRLQSGIARCELVKEFQILMHSKHAFEQRSRGLLLPQRKMRAGHVDFQLWRLWAATLAYSYFYCLTIDHQNAPIDTLVPAIDCILRAAAKRPSREIQPEGWYGPD